MLVLARVRSSTRLTITAQAVAGPGWPFFSGRDGNVPGTTTAYSGTSPTKVSPVSRSTILVEAPRNTPIASTAPLRTITPSATSERAPMKQSSSTMTGSACSGSSTPPMPTPPDMCTRLPICAQEPTVEQVERVIHGLADLAPGRGRDALASIERAVDGGFESGQRHRDFLDLG